MKGLVRDEDPSMPTLFVTRLRELGVAAIGQVFARGKERIVWLPGAESEERKDDVKSKLRKMMEDFQEEQEVEEEATGWERVVVVKSSHRRNCPCH